MLARKSRCMCWFIRQYVETKLHCNINQDDGFPWPNCGNIWSFAWKKQDTRHFPRMGHSCPHEAAVLYCSTIVYIYVCSSSLFTVHVHVSHRWPWKGLFVDLSISIGSVWALSLPPSIAVIGQHSLKLTYITIKFLLPSYFSIHLNQIIALKMEAIYSSETLEQISTTRCKTPKKQPLFESVCCYIFKQV